MVMIRPYESQVHDRKPNLRNANGEPTYLPRFWCHATGCEAKIATQGYTSPVTLTRQMLRVCLDVAVPRRLADKTPSPRANTALPAGLEAVVDGEDDEALKTIHQATSDERSQAKARHL